MKVINRNIGTPLLQHFCPSCGIETFNDCAEFDTEKGCFVKTCEKCGEELEFPNTAALIELLGIGKGGMKSCG